MLRALLELTGKRIAVPSLHACGGYFDSRSRCGRNGHCLATGNNSAKAGKPVKLEQRVIFAGGTGPMRRGRLIELVLTAIIDRDGILRLAHLGPVA